MDYSRKIIGTDDAGRNYYELEHGHIYTGSPVLGFIYVCASRARLQSLSSAGLMAYVTFR